MLVCVYNILYHHAGALSSIGLVSVYVCGFYATPCWAQIIIYMYNIFNPPAYVETETRAARAQHQITATHCDPNTRLEELLRTRAPNRRNKDGRINTEGLYPGVMAITVSPYHDQFQSQVEPGVWPAVKSLVDKGWFTVSSCEGHNDGMDDYYYIMLALADPSDVDLFRQQLAPVPGIEFSLFDSVANSEIVWKDTKTRAMTVLELKDGQPRPQEEARDINIIFYRNYEKYQWLKISLYPQGWGRFWSRHWREYIKKLLFFKRSRTMLENIVADQRFPTNEH